MPAVGWIGVGVSCLFYIQIVSLAFWSYAVQQRRKVMAQQSLSDDQSLTVPLVEIDEDALVRNPLQAK